MASVVQRLDSAIHRINPYPLDSAISFLNHNYNKIVKTDWLSTALISALTLIRWIVISATQLLNALPLSYRSLVGAKATKLGSCDKHPAYC